MLLLLTTRGAGMGGMNWNGSGGKEI